MRILVAGGCGFIGANLVRILLLAGHEVRVLDDESVGKRTALAGLGIDFVRGSITDRKAVLRALEGMDAVVHLAADSQVMDSIDNPMKNFDSNVVGSFTLLNAMRQAGVKRIVAASTGGAILGEAPCPVHEEIMPHPLSPYGASKMAMEGYLSAFGGAYGFKCASLRFSNVYGPGSFHKGSVVAQFFRQIINGEDLTLYGNGDQVRDYVYVIDLVQGIAAALEAEVTGIFQLGTGIPTTLNQLVDEMRQVVGPSYPFKVRYADARDGEIVNTYCDIGKAQNAFGYTTPTGLTQGLAETWAWFQRQYGSGADGCRVLYSIFDINNQGFLRRLSRLAGANVPTTILAFSRGTSGAGKAKNLQMLLASADVINLGEQSKGLSGKRLAQFVRGCARAILAAARSKPFNIVIARNLDMAIIALPFLLRRPRPCFVYEVLDIHPAAWSKSLLARMSRRFERIILNHADRVIVSTLAFHTEHLGPRMGVPADRVCLIENKIAPEQAKLVSRTLQTYARPIRIAYFGKLRCEKSIEILTALVGDFPGAFEVVLAGYPDAIPKELFDRFCALEAVNYRGTFSSVAELSSLIAGAHFVWAIDLQHAGANSSWLLPNRLYESVAMGLPVLALKGDACADHAIAHGWGVVLGDLAPKAIRDVLTGLTPAAYDQLRETIRATPPEDYVDTGDIVRLIADLSNETSSDSSPRSLVTGAATPDVAVPEPRIELRGASRR
jgi:UDP-glucose 4-epimerase